MPDMVKASAPNNGPLRAPRTRGIATEPANRTPGRPTKDGKYYRKSGRSGNAVAAHRRMTRPPGRTSSR